MCLTPRPIVVTHRLQDAFVMATHRYDEKAGMVELPKDGPHHGVDESTKFLMLNEGGIVFHGTTEELVHSGRSVDQGIICRKLGWGLAYL